MSSRLTVGFVVLGVVSGVFSNADAGQCKSVFGGSDVVLSSDALGSRSTEPATKPSDVKLYLTEKPKEPYKELGRVDAGKYNVVGRSRKREAIDQELKEKAAKLGADAIIQITEDFASVSGVAIKFEKQEKQ